jgi:PA14 domain
MKNLVYVCLLLALSGCAETDFQNVTQGPTGSPGVAGPQGNPGSNGTNGNGYEPGLECDVYSILANDENGTVNWSTMLSDGTLKFSTVLSNFNVPNESSNDVFSTFTAAQQALIGTSNYALDCSGFINVPETGSYTFTLGSDDGSELAIDETAVINMPDLQAYASESTTMSLFAGQHRINVIYFQGPPTNIGLTLSLNGPANAGLGETSVVPASMLTH